MNIVKSVKSLGIIAVLLLAFAPVSCSTKEEPEPVQYTIETFRKEFTFNFRAGSLRSLVTTNAPVWMTEDNYSWLRADVVESESDGKVLEISVDENDSDEQRKGTFDLIGSDESGNELVRVTVPVTQNPKSGLVDGAIMFEDPLFENLLLESFDLNEDKVITEDEIENVRELDFENLGIASIEGIKYFKNLEYLDVNQNKLKKLDVSGLTKLKYVHFNMNKVELFKCEGCTVLQTIMGRSNNLTEVNLSPVKDALKMLDLMQNNLGSLDLSGMKLLEYIAVGKNSLLSLKVDGCENLSIFSCNDNNLSKVDVSGLAKLMQFDCSNNFLSGLGLADNVTLGTLNVSGNSRITALDLSKCTMIHLDVSGTGISTLPFKDLSAIQTLRVSGTTLKDMDLSSCADLRTLVCNRMALNGLDLSANTLLEELTCMESGLTSLDLTRKAKLKNVNVSKNALTALDLGDSPLLESVDVSKNAGISLTLPKKFENNSSLKLSKDGDCKLQYR